MIKKLSQAALVMGGILALGGCTLGQLGQSSAEAPANKPPAADYQAPVAPSPPATNIRAICYNAADLAVFRARMLQQEFTVAALQCQSAGGARAYEQYYAQFLTKFKSELPTNFRSLTQLAARKRLNVDVVVTEFANRTAQRAHTDKEFCPRSKRALDWALSQQVTSLAQVPPPFDLGPEMNVYPCPGP
jgi:hypothetical protein